MKIYALLLPLLLLSCEKKINGENETAKSIEENCFILSSGVNYDEPPTPPKILTHQEILQNIPKHIQRVQLTDFQKFSYDKDQTQKWKDEEKIYSESPQYQTKYREIIAALPEFIYLSTSENYTLAKNKYGLWLLEKVGKKFNPYFLGFNQNIYLDQFYKQDQKFLKEGKMVLIGTVVDVQRLSRIPMLPKYDVIQEGVQFVIDLAEVKKDSDQDGFNDLFENFIGLNPNSSDSDSDGVSDFKDTNPKLKSEKSKFSGMYELFFDQDSVRSQYSFDEILTDCDYFLKINPKNVKVLMYTTKEKAPLKQDIMDLYFPAKYSKMKTYKNYPEVFFTDFSNLSGDGTVSAEFKNGTWKLDRKYTVTFGM